MLTDTDTTVRPVVAGFGVDPATLRAEAHWATG
jgi:hypothetical protein